MQFKNNKCIEISNQEYTEIKSIIDSSSCVADAVEKITMYLRAYKYCKFIDMVILKSMAFYLHQAITNNYKYLKIKD